MTVFVYEGMELNTDLITIDDMPTEVFKEIFELCGAETAVSLLLKMPANLIQVPARGFINIQKRLIQKNYDGTTASLRKMARDFKIPEMTIRRILNECRVNVPAENQLNFFEKKEEIIAE